MNGAETRKIKYEVYGPFPFNFSGKQDHRQVLNQFWDNIEAQEHSAGLSNAVGVYVWTIRQGKRHVPWNVGLTDKQGFKARFFQKKASVLEMLIANPDAEIQVYLLALCSKGGKFKRPTKSEKINVNHWLETTLIGAAINVNPDLHNKAKASYLRRAIVDGYWNDEVEKRSDAAKSFNRLFRA